MKKLILALLILSTLSSCQQELNCGMSQAKTLVRIILVENTDLDNHKYSENLVTEDYLHRFYSDRVEIQAIRTTSIDKKIGKCTCEAELYFRLPESTLEKLEAGKAQSFDITYSIQETEDDMIYATTRMPIGLEERVALYIDLVKQGEQELSRAKFLDFDSEDGYYLKFKHKGDTLVFFNNDLDTSKLKSGDRYNLIFTSQIRDIDIDGNQTERYEYYTLVSLKEWP